MYLNDVWQLRLGLWRGFRIKKVDNQIAVLDTHHDDGQEMMCKGEAWVRARKNVGMVKERNVKCKEKLPSNHTIPLPPTVHTSEQSHTSTIPTVENRTKQALHAQITRSHKKLHRQMASAQDCISANRWYRLGDDADPREHPQL
jgi:hypothetical protein